MGNYTHNRSRANTRAIIAAKTIKQFESSNILELGYRRVASGGGGEDPQKQSPGNKTMYEALPLFCIMINMKLLCDHIDQNIHVLLRNSFMQLKTISTMNVIMCMHIIMTQ